MDDDTKVAYTTERHSLHVCGLQKALEQPTHDCYAAEDTLGPERASNQLQTHIPYYHMSPTQWMYAHRTLAPKVPLAVLLWSLINALSLLQHEHELQRDDFINDHVIWHIQMRQGFPAPSQDPHPYLYPKYSKPSSIP